MKQLQKKFYVIFFTILITISNVLFLTSCKQTSETSNEKQVLEPISSNGFLLDTYITITLYDSQDQSILDGAFKLCEQYENQLSRTKESSEIFKFNQMKEPKTITVSETTAQLLERALFYCDRSHGSFDITIAPVSSLWDFKSDEKKLPNSEELSTNLQYINYKNLQLNGTTLHSSNPNTQIDLGAIAKGFIADKIKEYLLDCGVKSAIINLGGNVLCVGNKPDGSPFYIGVQKPFEGEDETIQVVKINDMSVVTSGVYERYFKLDDKVYHHILNPKTGYPYENHLLSVTILSDKSVDGDGLSTSCFSLGLTEGMKLIESLDNTYAIFVTDDGQIHYTKGTEDFLDEEE